MQLQIKLVEITIADLPQIQVIDQACLGGFWSLEGYLQEIERPNSYLISVMSREKVILGFGCLWAILEEAHITMLAVRPEYQRQGLGKYVVWGLLEKAWSQGLEWATLEVRASNLAAIALYEKFGFTVIGKRPKYYEITQEDALVMWRKGLHYPEFKDSLQAWHQEIREVITLRGWEIV
ncbi:ribosomal-protein-alanine acetyltransferase [Synechococcus sp. PCC 7502]|uniref:ribosomal protein S18-alanine N-acetyltransferase n=1 Tax=Synechococcus sp. PCC 7502 TaxID=1173263 RepID=UPI00029F82DC|nr:ribosomal protein S18-alanine N-acetyltransferase [Synechococcus sp. PCC 7502]AFY72327.1 ribosomal-protein-alanine acetyltransferase [Synechococcus sp. PCC 7502]